METIPQALVQAGNSQALKSYQDVIVIARHADALRPPTIMATQPLYPQVRDTSFPENTA